MVKLFRKMTYVYPEIRVDILPPGDSRFGVDSQLCVFTMVRTCLLHPDEHTTRYANRTHSCTGRDSAQASQEIGNYMTRRTQYQLLTNSAQHVLLTIRPTRFCQMYIESSIFTQLDNPDWTTISSHALAGTSVQCITTGRALLDLRQPSYP
jgi:hypothetical protein